MIQPSGWVAFFILLSLYFLIFLIQLKNKMYHNLEQVILLISMNIVVIIIHHLFHYYHIITIIQENFTIIILIITDVTILYDY